MAIRQISNLLNEQNQTHISSILSHLEQAVQHYDTLTGQLQKGLQTLPQLSSELTSTFKQTRQVMENTSQVLQKLNQQQGLVDNLTQGSLEMTRTLTSLNETGVAITQSAHNWINC